MQYTPDALTITKINAARNPKEVQQVLSTVRSNLASVSSTLPHVEKVKKNKLNISEVTNTLGVSVSAGLKVQEANEIKGRSGKLKVYEASEPTKSTGKKPKLPKNFPVLVELDQSQLESTKASTTALAKLESHLRELGYMRQVVMGRGFDLPSKDKLLKAIESSGKEAHKMVNQAKSALSKVSKHNTKAVPPEHYLICKAAATLLSNPKILDPKQYTQILYKRNASNTTFVLARSDNSYMVQTFIRIEHLVNNEDVSYEDYAVVISGVIEVLDDEEAIINYYITSIKNDRTPGSFPIGKTAVKSPSDFNRRITSLLSIDGFMGDFEKKPFKKSTRELRDTSSLTVRPVDGGVDIASIGVSKGSIWAQLTSGSEEEFKVTVTEIMGAIRETFRLPKNATIQYKIKPKRNGSRLYIFDHILDVRGSNKATFTNAKINMISSMLDLTPAQKGELRNSLK